MDQTPIHDSHNPDLLALIPRRVKKVVEVGCSSGALAREFKKNFPNTNWLGIEIDPGYVALSKRYCDDSLLLDIEQADDKFWKAQGSRDCWIFGDALERLKDPWRVLRNIKLIMPANGCVVACIPNAQHWSLQARLNIGDWRYEESGLLDRTHLRWFTRQTIIEMFDMAGFQIEAGHPRIFHEPNRDQFLPLLEQIARLAGADPKVAIEDALPLQYVVRAVLK